MSCVKSQHPWSGCPRIISWCDMLRFSAEKFYHLSEELSRQRGVTSVLGVKSPAMQEIRDLCSQLGLESACDQMERLFTDQIVFSEEASPEQRAKRINELFGELHRRIYDELARKMCLCVPTERTKYCNPLWLLNTAVSSKFPTALKELRAAGRCYAFGESDASAFHSMRALEVALTSIARYFEIPCDSTNWHPIIEQLESKIRDISKLPKTPERLVDEKFFGGIARHFMFLKNAWRNHVMHVHGNYNDREAYQMLEHVEYLLTDMAPRLSEEGVADIPSV